MIENADVDTAAPIIGKTCLAPEPSRIFYWALAVPLAALLVWLSLRGTDWRRVGTVLSGARLGLIALACAITSAACFLRALRWRVLLNAREKLGAVPVFWATMAGYLGNNLLPARAGELVRAVLVSRRSALSKTYVLTTAATERLTDAIVLVVASRLLLLGIHQKPAWLEGAATTTSIAALLGATLVAGLRWRHATIARILAVVSAPAHVRSRLVGMLEQAVLGFSALDHPARLASFCGLTALIWTADAARATIVARALGLSLPFAVAILLITGLGLGSALPATPGYLGIYQFVAINVLVPFGFTRDEALAYILLAQAGGYAVITLWGVAGLWRMGGTKVAGC
ncbi:MAG TPA: lysylphosphatidylglycerol synthase transmembrane domain-containing protein [Terriglobales bacterium]|nr:lysylphosphatidylglycerol synthase transmembrane domain-containing protein [Terriglobales bacterium]